ncbi:MAG: DNA mismatch endonuclease Vsr [Armatimonadota bacterium]|nr:DNA mismatch endonuclease Vsr [Armatimonadota bacterium]
MTDVFSESKRSWIMSRVREKNTSPELIVRSFVHRLGYRFRLHRKDLPGKPDIVFPSRRKVIFVHGCFWHGHQCPRGDRIPKTRQSYWLEKIARNTTRDSQHEQELASLGWKSLVIWECQIKDLGLLHSTIVAFLDGT